MNQNAILLGFGADHLVTFGVGPAGSLVQGFLCIDPARRCGCVGTLCGSDCPSCPGAKLPLTIPITDANGTWQATLRGGFGGWIGWVANAWGPVGALDNRSLPGECVSQGAGTIGYTVGLRCYLDGSGLQIARSYQTQLTDLLSLGGVCCGGYEGFALVYHDFFADTIACPWGSLTPKFHVENCVNGSWSGDFVVNPPPTPPDPWGSAVSVAWTGSDTAHSVCCSPCPIPKKNLTVCWHNVFSGYGSTPLIYTPPGQWNSACSNHLLYSLSCAGGQTQFSVTYFTSGDCPDGTRQSCTSGSASPLGLVLADYTCSPFMLHYTCSAMRCAVLGDDGYTDFWVTETTCPYGP